MLRSRILTLTAPFALALMSLSGCMENRRSEIPNSATLASSGNTRVTYTAPQAGTIWIYDAQNDKIDYSGPIDMNQSVVIDPPTRQITIEGRIVSDQVISAGDEHRIFYRPNSMMGSGS
jgi:hypothetical protein